MKNKNKINCNNNKRYPMSEGNTCRAKPGGIIYPLHKFSKGLV